MPARGGRTLPARRRDGAYLRSAQHRTQRRRARHEIDPAKQVEDYSDALTFLSGSPTVDPGRIGFWGMSFSGALALAAGGLDKRAKFCIVVCPLATFHQDARLVPVLAKAAQDRAAQLRARTAPLYLPVFTPAGANPVGMAAGDGEAVRVCTFVHRQRARPRGAQPREPHDDPVLLPHGAVVA